MEKNVYAFKGFVYNLKAVSPKWKEISLYTLFSCCYKAFPFQSYTKMPYCDSLVCCYIMKCCKCISLLCFSVVLCIGGNSLARDWKSSSVFCFVLFRFVFDQHVLLICIPYNRSYSCCFFVLFVYLRLISGWTEREPSLAFTSLNSTSHFILNLSDGFHSFCLDETKDGVFSVQIKKCLPLSSDKCLYFKKKNRLSFNHVRKTNVLYVIRVSERQKKKILFPTWSRTCHVSVTHLN